jgi:hypothetical protein
VIGMTVAAAAFILAAAEPFANALVAHGAQLGIDEFLLVQWLAPLVSESPELFVAGLLACRLKGDDAMGTLLSSKANQWTLLVGTLPLACLLGGGGAGGLELDARQTGEFLLTAAQAVLGSPCSPTCASVDGKREPFSRCLRSSSPSRKPRCGSVSLSPTGRLRSCCWFCIGAACGPSESTCSAHSGMTPTATFAMRETSILATRTSHTAIAARTGPARPRNAPR